MACARLFLYLELMCRGGDSRSQCWGVIPVPAWLSAYGFKDMHIHVCIICTHVFVCVGENCGNEHAVLTGGLTILV